MSYALKSGLCVAALLSSAPFAVAQTATDSEPALQDVIIVTGRFQETATGTTMDPDLMPAEGPDVARLMTRTPGGALVGNGALSGQVQYRGLFGERLNLRVDGQHFASGGPNLMDPAFHYAPMPLIDHLVIDRGVSPVSAGPGLGGGVDAVFKRVDYADTASPSFGYDLSFGARSVDESIAAGGVVGAATDHWRFNLLGAYEEGDDYAYGDGRVGGSQFERAVFGLSGGVKFGSHELTLDARRQNTGDSGNPPFPMDIRYFDADFLRLGYLGDFDGFDLKAEIASADVAHAMNNFDLRPSPAMMQMRESLASAETHSGAVSILFSALQGDVELGLDGSDTTHDMQITNPMNADFYVGALPDIETTRFGAFAQWSGMIGLLNSELGLRIDSHESDAGTARLGPALPMGPTMLAMAFNNADTSWRDETVDAVARFWTPEQNGLSWRVTLARKSQVPSYLQRFGWLPLNASGGLADGNIYVGDLSLDPEVAWIGEAGFDYRSDRFYARPTVFIRQIDNFVQGVPFDDTVGVIDTPQEMIANMNGDPTPLRFANVDARLYGLDFDFGYDLTGPLRLDGVFNYVRGERRDIDDNLYRIAPPSLTTALTWEEADWSASFEARAVAEQDDVSFTNSEAQTPGYVVLNLYADWQIKPGIQLSFGIENLLDQVYRDHLSGYNRNADSDVALGTRVPGAGRGGFIRLSLSS